jgi:hypothetical protein
MTCIKYLLYLILIGGLVLIIYGSSTIPNEIPGHTSIYSGSSESISAQSQQHQNDLRNYQIRSKEFLITMIGLGIFLIGLIFCVFSYYRDEYFASNVRIAPNNRLKPNLHKLIELKNNNEKATISKTEVAVAPKIDELRPLESTIVPSLESNLSQPTNITTKIILAPNKHVQFNIPQTYQYPKPLYYKYLPQNYQEYYNKNGYPIPIPYQMVR